MTNDLKLFRWYDYVIWLIIILVLVISYYFVQRYSNQVISDSTLESQPSQFDVSSFIIESPVDYSRVIYRTKDGLIQLNDNVVSQVENFKTTDPLKNKSSVDTSYFNDIQLSPNKNFALFINKTIEKDYQYDPNTPQELKILEFSSGKETTVLKTKNRLFIGDFNWNVDGESISFVTSFPSYINNQKVQVRYPNNMPPIYLNNLDLKNGNITTKTITFPYEWYDFSYIKDLRYYNDSFYFRHDSSSSKYAFMSFKDELNTIDDTTGYTSTPILVSDSKHNKFIIVGQKSIFSYDLKTQSKSSLDIPYYGTDYFNPTLSSDGTKLFMRRVQTLEGGIKTVEDAVYMYDLQTKENKKIYDLGISPFGYYQLASMSYKDENDSLYISRFNGSQEIIKNILVNITTLKAEDILGLPEYAYVVN